MSRQNRPGDVTNGVSRRTLVQAGVGLAGGGLLSTISFPLFAADHPALGTYPAGSAGDSVFIGIAVPRTGAYAVQGRAATFIEHMAGSYSGIMGLPVFETAALLRQAGFKC